VTVKVPHQGHGGADLVTNVKIDWRQNEMIELETAMMKALVALAAPPGAHRQFHRRPRWRPVHRMASARSASRDDECGKSREGREGRAVRRDDGRGVLSPHPKATGRPACGDSLRWDRRRAARRPDDPARICALDGVARAYVLPANVGDARLLAGDGVAVPVVRYLAAHVLKPILDEAQKICSLGMGQASACSLKTGDSGLGSAADEKVGSGLSHDLAGEPGMGVVAEVNQVHGEPTARTPLMTRDLLTLTRALDGIVGNDRQGCRAGTAYLSTGPPKKKPPGFHPSGLKALHSTPYKRALS
jgi:hypothetical protein